MAFKMIQLTNDSIGAVAIGEDMPLGTITRKIGSTSNGCATFSIENSNSNTIVLNDKGYYDVTYNASLVASVAGNISVSLIINGSSVYTATATIVEGATANITIPYTVRVFANCCSCPTNNPVSIQFELGGVGITSGVSNVQIEKRAD